MAIRTASFSETRPRHRPQMPFGTSSADSPRPRQFPAEPGGALTEPDLRLTSPVASQAPSHRVPLHRASVVPKPTFRRDSYSSSCNEEIDLRRQRCASHIGITEYGRSHLETPDVVSKPEQVLELSVLHDSGETCGAPTYVFRFRLESRFPSRSPVLVRRLDRALLTPCGVWCTTEHMLDRHLQPTICLRIQSDHPCLDGLFVSEDE